MKKRAKRSRAESTTAVRKSWVDQDKARALLPVMKKLSKQGKGTARALLDASSDPSSQTHHCFDWSDASAGDKWRLHQATNYWGALRVVIESSGDEPKASPAFIPIRINRNERSYRPIQEVLENPDWTTQMLEQAKRELDSFRKRYAMLESLSKLKPVFQAIAEALSPAAANQAATKPAVKKASKRPNRKAA